ncbi:hypothetical protein GGR56DRAFT_660516 [Xylariaceae sp. FL0804]|nr:hypothetical protein GGR56DRAFT_660516 [Xylariaceae sp. FL0804]
MRWLASKNGWLICYHANLLRSLRPCLAQGSRTPMLIMVFRKGGHLEKFRITLQLFLDLRNLVLVVHVLTRPRGLSFHSPFGYIGTGRTGRTGDR